MPKKKVLIADDEPAMRQLLSAIMEEEGFEVTRAADGQEAADLLRTRHFDNVLAYLALLKRSTSTVLALRNTLRAVQARLAELASARQEELDAQQQRRQTLKALQRKVARYGTLTLDEESEQEEKDAHRHGGEELNREQVWPGHHRVIWLLLDADNRVLFHQRKESIRTCRHWDALLINLRTSRRINRRNGCWALLVAHRCASLIVAR